MQPQQVSVNVGFQPFPKRSSPRAGQGYRRRNRAETRRPLLAGAPQDPHSAASQHQPAARQQWPGKPRNKPARLGQECRAREPRGHGGTLGQLGSENIRREYLLESTTRRLVGLSSHLSGLITLLMVSLRGLIKVTPVISKLMSPAIRGY